MFESVSWNGSARRDSDWRKERAKSAPNAEELRRFFCTEVSVIRNERRENRFWKLFERQRRTCTVFVRTKKNIFRIVFFFFSVNLSVTRNVVDTLCVRVAFYWEKKIKDWRQQRDDSHTECLSYANRFRQGIISALFGYRKDHTSFIASDCSIEKQHALGATAHWRCIPYST